MSCTTCGAKPVEDGTGGVYLPHFHDCPYRKSYVAPRRTLRTRGGVVIDNARSKIAEVNWWLVLIVLVLAVLFALGLSAFFDWLEHAERTGL